MSVERIWEAPRVTKPYTDEQWLAIQALGRQIDVDLLEADVRLTMGGEPTFVAIDDPDGPEWNTAALGANKRRLAGELFQRLRQHYAPQGLVHFGQGKWYPGEQLPRWSLNCHWRRDGVPVWRNNALIADEHEDYAADALLAGRFLASVAERLKLPARFVFPAYEDNFYYLWREGGLPLNVSAEDSRLEDALERQRLRKVFSQGLDKVIGQVLPLARTAKGDQWQSGRWYLRDSHCRLVPGDSPLGYRLPLASQPWVTAAEYPFIHATDPNQDFPELAGAAQLAAIDEPAVADERVPQVDESADWLTRTALCAEAREGRLYLFMPPLERLEDYLQLVSVIEATAEELRCPVLLEGYEPPADPRLCNFRVTPDPGVIEVNVQPSVSWDELVERTEFLYEQARQTRLTSEKFMIDGRHTGTGGGNHFVLGGAPRPTRRSCGAPTCCAA